jgi:soluble lytic murein transglycosylase
MKDKEDGVLILKKIIRNLASAGKVGAIIKLIEEIADGELTHKIYRYSNRKNVFFIGKQYKIIEEIRKYKNPALIHALIKQESGFAASARSSAGAVGFMQIMPDTAKQVAKKLKVKYSGKKLGSDIHYNMHIGSNYIESLLKKFDGSKILAIASYNAGPRRTKKWIEEFYDPRIYSNANNYDAENIDKVVDWIELITYSETRNYIQRVMENLLIYNYLL